MYKLAVIVISFFLTIISFETHALEIYRITSEECVGGKTTTLQTGFSLSPEAEIVTALHGVSGCSKITARRFDGQKIVSVLEDLFVERADIQRDLAILTKSGLNKLDFSSYIAASEDTEVKITGFPQGSSTPDTIRVRIGEPAIRPLRSILRPKDILKYQSIGSPSPAINILRLDGNAQIGHSGAPLIDSDKNLIGIVIGGYALGEFGTFWAIPFSDINWSKISTEDFNKIAQLHGQFSSQVEAPISIAQLRLTCSPEDNDALSTFDLTKVEASQLADFAGTLEASKDKFIYADVTLEQNDCLACKCARELKSPNSDFDTSENQNGYAAFIGSLGLTTQEAPLAPTLWREGYRINTFVYDEFATTITFAFPMPHHLENSQYRYTADRAIRLGFDGIFVSREHFRTGWQMFHLEPTEIDATLKRRLNCIRRHLERGEDEVAQQSC